MTTLKREGIMLWFTLGLMLGGFLGMLLMGIFASKRIPEDDPGEKAFRKASRRPDENRGIDNNSPTPG